MTPTTTTAKPITIAPAPTDLYKFHHAEPIRRAEKLAERITELEAAGYTVKNAIGARSSVPNSYRSAFKINAPYWVFVPEAREIRMVAGKLQNRSKGATIPSHIFIAGVVPTPEGFRCVGRTEDTTEIVPA